MYMKSADNNGKFVKPAYESLTCGILEVETQGVLCASNSDEGSLTGGLNLYNGSAL